MVSKHGHKSPAVKPWVWKKEHDQVNGRIDHTLLKAMTTVTDSIVALLKDSCLSRGTYLPDWHGLYFAADKQDSASRMTFGFECHFLVHAPSEPVGTSMNAESSARIRVMANYVELLFADTLLVNGKVFRTMKATATNRNGFTFFQFPAAGTGTAAVDSTTSTDAAASPTDQRNLSSKAWLITADPEKLPYIPVSRKEYLEVASLEVKAEREKLIATVKERAPVRSAEKQKAEKEAAINDINQSYSGVEAQLRIRSFTRSYKTDEDYQKDQIDKETAEVDAKLRLLDSLLTRGSAVELKKPAIVTVSAMNFEAFEDSLPGRKILYQVNPVYFDPSSTGAKAQCFLFCYDYDPSEPIARDIDNTLNEKFDFKKLQALLGK
jgi:hypothetical protein